MADIPAARLDDKINATRFSAWAGMFVDIQPHYCALGDRDISQIDFSPVISIFYLSTWRVCLGQDVDWCLGLVGNLVYSPNYPPGNIATDNLASYLIDWGDGTTDGGDPGGDPPVCGTHGAGALEWPTAGDYTITVTLTDDAGYSTTIRVQIEVVDCTLFPFDGYAGSDGSGVYRATTWTAVNGDLSGDWLYVYDIDINYARKQGGHYQVLIATKAGLAISDDGGASWRRIELSNPADTWGVGVTAARLSYRRIARDASNPDVCYVIADYDSGGGNWVGYMLRTSDNWASYTWYPLGGAYQTVATWGYVQETSLYYHHREGSGSPVYSPVSQTNLLGAPDGQYGGARVDFVNRQNDMNPAMVFLLLDLGAWIELSAATVDGGINYEAIIGASADTMTFVAADMDIRLYTEPNSFIGQWAGGAGYPPAVPTALNGSPSISTEFRRIVVQLWSSPGAYTGTGMFRHLFDGFRFYPSAVYPWLKPYDIAVSRGDGRYLYMTTWEGGGVCWRVYDTTLSVSQPLYAIRQLRSGTSAANHVQVLTPYMPTIPQRNQKALLHGDWSTNWERLAVVDLDPALFQQYGYWQNVTRTEIGATYGGAASLAVAADWLDEDHFYAVDINAPYVTIDGGATWTARTVVHANFEVSPQSIISHPDYVGEYALPNSNIAAGDARRVVYSMDDGLVWMDLSAGLPAGLDINVVRLLSEVP
jgi:hypothetical protein